MWKSRVMSVALKLIEFLVLGVWSFWRRWRRGRSEETKRILIRPLLSILIQICLSFVFLEWRWYKQYCAVETISVFHNNYEKAVSLPPRKVCAYPLTLFIFFHENMRGARVFPSNHICVLSGTLCPSTWSSEELNWMMIQLTSIFQGPFIPFAQWGRRTDLLLLDEV